MSFGQRAVDYLSHFIILCSWWRQHRNKNTLHRLANGLLQWKPNETKWCGREMKRNKMKIINKRREVKRTNENNFSNANWIASLQVVSCCSVADEIAKFNRLELVDMPWEYIVECGHGVVDFILCSRHSSHWIRIIMKHIMLQRSCQMFNFINVPSWRMRSRSEERIVLFSISI